MTIGLIGYGRFGRLASAILARKASVVVWDPSLAPGIRLASRVATVTLDIAAGQPLVVLAVPVSALRGVLRRIRPAVMPRATIVDVCAVKSKPVKWMRGLLPRSVAILGTHPLFGPDSFTGSLKGHRIVLCPVRGPVAVVRTARKVLTKAGLSVTVMTPEAHDRMMAETVFLTQLVGRLLHLAKLGGAEGWTVHYRSLQSIVAVARNDSEQLFLDMWRFNPHARDIARRLGSGVTKLRRRLVAPSP